MYDRTRRPPRIASMFALTFAVAIAGCPSDDDPGLEGGTQGEATSTGAAEDSTGSDPGFDEAEVIAMAADYATSLTKVNDEARPSQHGLAATVNFYVNQSSLAAYLMLDPAMPAPVDLPEGTLLVKEHLDAAGGQDGFLLMYKAPAGYNPAAADWFWARVDGTGATKETGVVGFCVSCHEQVADAGYAFGVPLDNRL